MGDFFFVVTNHHLVNLKTSHFIKTIPVRNNDIVRFNGVINLFNKVLTVKVDSIEVIGHDDTEDNFVKNGYK